MALASKVVEVHCRTEICAPSSKGALRTGAQAAANERFDRPAASSCI
jgi:hypothetical protein